MFQSTDALANPRLQRLTIPTTLSTTETISWLIIEGAERVARETCDLYLSIALVATRREDGGLLDEAEDQIERWTKRHETLCSVASLSLKSGISEALTIIREYSVAGVRLALLETEYGDEMLEAYLEDGK